MKPTIQRTAVFLALTGTIIGLATASHRSVAAQRKPAPAHIQIPAPLTQAQVRRIFPGTMTSVAVRPDTFTLYTIQPMQTEFDSSKNKTIYFSNSVEGYKIVGKAIITDRNEQARLLASAFYTGPDGFPLAGCFTPHHALRLVKKKRVVDIIICFGCGGTEIWENGVKKPGGVANKPAEEYVASVLRKHHIHQPR